MNGYPENEYYDFFIAKLLKVKFKKRKRFILFKSTSIIYFFRRKFKNCKRKTF